MTEPAAPIPTAARLLGWSGLIPFLTPAVIALFGLSPLAPGWVWRAYGAVILAFMAGVQWGFAVKSDKQDGVAAGRYAVSVLPALLGWASLACTPRVGWTVQIIGFLALLAYDLWTVRGGQAPRWYSRLRIELTAVVCLSLVVEILRGGT